MTEPTDAAIDTLILEHGVMGQAWPTQRQLHAFARAVLAKWGTPPAVAGEPVAWLSTDSIGERYLCFTKPNDSDPVRPLVFGDTTPHPSADSLEITPPNNIGSTQCIVRWQVETPKGWAGAWNREALEYLIGRTQVDSVLEDAARYQWLRLALADRTNNGKSHWFCSIAAGHPEELDAAIDAARKQVVNNVK